MIDRKTGNITLFTACQLKAKDAFDNVLALLSGEVQEVVDRQNGWKWLTVKNLKVDGDYFILSLGFYVNALKMIELIVSKDPFDLTADWNSGSECDELAILQKLQVWLRTELGHEGNFEWGEAQATYDPKGGSSSVSIRYK